MNRRSFLARMGAIFGLGAASSLATGASPSTAARTSPAPLTVVSDRCEMSTIDERGIPFAIRPTWAWRPYGYDVAIQDGTMRITRVA